MCQKCARGGGRAADALELPLSAAPCGSPNQTITVNEAITMICRALGYTAQAKELVGAWPANYIALGQQLKLYTDVEAVGTVDRASAAQIVYNSLTVSKVYIDADGATKVVVDTTSPLNPQPALTMLDTLDCVNAGDVVINSGDVATAKTNITKLLGAYATVYKKDGDVIAAKELSTFIAGKYKNDGNKFVAEDDTEYNLNSATIVGGDEITNGDSSVGTFNGFVAGDNNKKFTIAVKVSGKTVKEIYSVAQWDKTANYDAYLFEEDMLDVDKCKLNGKTFAKDDNGEIDMNSFILNGVASLDKIAEDNVVEVYTDGTNITKIEVGTQTVAGEVTKMASDKEWVIIDGTKYKLDSTTLDIDLKQTGTAYLTFGGKIFDWDVDDVAAGNYAILVATKSAPGFGGTEDFVQLYTKYGNTIKPEYDPTACPDVMPGNIDKIFEYSLDADGAIDSLTLATTTTAVSSGKVNEKCTRIGTNPVADDVVVFLQDNAGDWKIGNIKNFKKDTEFDFTGKVVLDGSKILAIAVSEATAIGSTATYGVINDISKATNADGKKAWFIDGFNDGAELHACTSTLASVSLGTVAVSGPTDTYKGLYQINVDADGVIKNISVVSLAATDIEEITTVSGVKAAKLEITGDDGKVYGLTEKVVMYYYDADEEEYVILTSMTNLKNKHVMLFRTDSDLDGFDIVVAYDN